MNELMNNPWLNLAYTPASATWNLICFPFAGGSAEYFLPWRALLNDVALYPIQLPGRSARWQEQAHSTIDGLLEEMMPILIPLIQAKPYVLFGHSMGGYIAYMVAKKLKDLGLKEPDCLVLSAVPAPMHWNNSKKISTLSQEEFSLFFEQLGGFDPELLKHKSFMDFQMSLLRQDVRLCEHCHTKETSRLNCPILAISATDDPHVQPEHMQAWEQLSTVKFTHEIMSGDHFYLTKKKDTLTRVIKQQVNQEVGT